ncbi:hypothetical protein FF011L_42850 [Roseimaritima multifibrata]|uniref:DUF58 domain-containing protein n=1 Tax=Roseimaritima multifibrata TaxID=1930274 RepID=A0A517MKS8_9BACT|nr:DUF58 domain-containing protein [Roseimaritima multifibrata]QDS95489.1 hypothetical protein FF011L_42850 [Roseimaritima multifibrata]
MDLTTDTQSAFQWISALPWMLLAMVALPLLILARFFRVYPSWLWLGVLTTSLIASLLTITNNQLLIMVALLDGLLVAVVGLDLMFLWLSTSNGLRAWRDIPSTASIGKAMAYDLTIENTTFTTIRGAVRDDLPEPFRGDPDQHPLKLPRSSRITVQRRITPLQRGAFNLKRVYVRARSQLGFWQRFLQIDVEDRLKVYPDMQQLSDYALLARTNRLSLIGVRRTRRIGQDSDFERLRDYSRDDNYRHIDWRSTARRRKLTVRQFQSDQSQRLIFMLDCGRMMTNERAGYSLLDHALNASLMLAYVALEQGDAVGMLCFSDTIHAYIPPRGGKNQMNRLIQAGYDQFPRLVESRYDEAFLYLSNHCKRRSMVVLETNIIDEVNAAQVVDYLGNISGRHLPVGVLLRDRQMFDTADHPGGGRENMLRAAVASEILCWRDQVIRDLTHRGVLMVDTFPDELTAPLVNQYLEIKAKHLL